MIIENTLVIPHVAFYYRRSSSGREYILIKNKMTKIIVNAMELKDFHLFEVFPEDGRIEICYTIRNRQKGNKLGLISCDFKSDKDSVNAFAGLKEFLSSMAYLKVKNEYDSLQLLNNGTQQIINSIVNDVNVNMQSSSSSSANHVNSSSSSNNHMNNNNDDNKFQFDDKFIEQYLSNNNLEFLYDINNDDSNDNSNDSNNMNISSNSNSN
jgi:hypothetical protein